MLTAVAERRKIHQHVNAPLGSMIRSLQVQTLLPFCLFIITVFTRPSGHTADIDVVPTPPRCVSFAFHRARIRHSYRSSVSIEVSQLMLSHFRRRNETNKHVLCITLHTSRDSDSSARARNDTSLSSTHRQSYLVPNQARSSRYTFRSSVQNICACFPLERNVIHTMPALPGTQIFIASITKNRRANSEPAQNLILLRLQSYPAPAAARRRPTVVALLRFRAVHRSDAKRCRDRRGSRGVERWGGDQYVGGRGRVRGSTRISGGGGGGGGSSIPCVRRLSPGAVAPGVQPLHGKGVRRFTRGSGGRGRRSNSVRGRSRGGDGNRGGHGGKNESRRRGGDGNRGGHGSRNGSRRRGGGGSWSRNWSRSGNNQAGSGGRRRLSRANVASLLRRRMAKKGREGVVQCSGPAFHQVQSEL